MISTCRPTLVVDPILWLPMTRMERSQVLRWRLGWLPGGKPRPCPFHPTTNLTRAHVTDCLQIHRRLQLPESIKDPLSFLLDLLPLKQPTNAQYSASWAVHPPHIGTSLVEWLYR
ncbi:hypothetical protein BD408DRAFT_416430 [Parasitella parasitica]|nr:hypothetical protein BD408DRAFT_416430 [Parasitella parasitica]